MTADKPKAPLKIDNLITFMNSPEVVATQFLLIGDLHQQIGVKLFLSSLLFAAAAAHAGKKYLFHEIPITHLWKFRAAQRGSWIIHKLSPLLRRARLNPDAWQAAFKARYARIIRKSIEAIPSSWDTKSYAAAIEELTRHAGRSGPMIVPADVRGSYQISADPYMGSSLLATIAVRKAVIKNKQLAQKSEELFGSKDWWTEPFEKHGIQNLTFKKMSVMGILIDSDPIDSPLEFDTGEKIRTLARGQGGTANFGDLHLNAKMINGLGGEKNVTLLSMFEDMEGAKIGLMMRALHGVPPSHVYILGEDKILAPEDYYKMWDGLYGKCEKFYEAWRDIYGSRSEPSSLPQRGKLRSWCRWLDLN